MTRAGILLLLATALYARPGEDRPFVVETPEEDLFDRPDLHDSPGRRTMRRLALEGLSADIARDRLLAWPFMTGALRPEDVLVDPGGHALILLAPPAVVAEAVQVLKQLDGDPRAQTATIELSFLDIEGLREAVDRLGPAALGGIRGQDLTYIAPSRQVLVRGNPEGVARLRSLIQRLDQAPTSVTVGVRAASTSRTRTRRVGLDAPDPGRGGRISLTAEEDVTREDPILWVTTLDGSPARFDAGQIFNIVLPAVRVGPAGIASTLTPQEVFVGTSLEVTPRVRGKLVELEIGFSRASPGRISPLGVDRDQRAVGTRVLVPRGGSATIGGIVDQMRNAGYDGSSLTSTDLSLTVFVR